MVILSHLLYVLSMEVLACNVRASPVTQGITLPGLSTPLPVLSLYADEVSVIVSSDGAMKEAFYTYARFERGTGSKLNLDKCEGLWLGNWRGRPDSPVPFQWTSSKIMVLGTFIGNGNLEEANCCSRVDAVAKCVSAWSSHNLSYGESALISNALALARVWYTATMLPIPGWTLGKLKRIIFPFFWKGKKDLVARAMVIQSRSCGGFGIVATHLKSQALLLQWIKRFWAASYGWRLFLVYWTQSVSRASPGELLASPFSFNLKRLPPFYAAVLDAWRAVDGHAYADLCHLFIGGPTAEVPVSNIPCKSCYDLVLGGNRRSPIWVMRNNHRYCQVPPRAVGLIAATKSRLRFYLPLLAKRFHSCRRRRYFKRQWGASGVIGRFHNGRFNVII